MIGGDIGAWFVNYILEVAFQLTGSESAPGVVSLLLVAALIVLSLCYIGKTWWFYRAVHSARNIVRGENEELITLKSRIPIDRAFKAHIEKKKGTKYFLAIAWKEFAETTVGSEDQTSKLRNTTRPSAFFTREEIDREWKVWRQIPAIFVSVGLFLTFLGLVAALQQTGNVLDAASVGHNTTEGLKTLLQVASAKFIMSLTGLFCSILFIIVLRACESKKEGALVNLCSEIEKGCLFQDEQTLLNKLLKQSQEQTQQLQSFSTDLVAQVGRPLQELPNTIHEAFRQHMAPALEQIANNTGTGITSLVETVSQQLSGGIQDSAQAMRDEINTVRSALETVTQRLETSGDRMATGINGAVDSLRQSLLDPMSTLVVQIQEFASQISAATNQTGQYAKAMEDNTAAIASTNEQFRQAADALVRAVTPVRDAVERIETASNAMGERIEVAIQAFTASVHETAEQTQSAAKNAQAEIEASRAVMQDGLNAVRTATDNFAQIVDRYREIDSNLGDAFKQIETAVRASIESIGKFQVSLDEKFADALGRLEALIARTEPFEPRRRQ